MPALSADVLAKPYPMTLVAEKQIETGLFLQHLCSHAAFHLGQVGYLRRALTGDTRSASPVLLTAIMSPA